MPPSHRLGPCRGLTLLRRLALPLLCGRLPDPLLRHGPLVDQSHHREPLYRRWNPCLVVPVKSCSQAAR